MLQTVLFQTIQFSISTVFCLHTVKCKTVLFQAIQFIISTQFTSRILVGVVLPLCKEADGASMTFVVGVLPLCRDAVGVFCSPIRLGHGSWRKEKSQTKRNYVNSEVARIR